MFIPFIFALCPFLGTGIMAYNAAVGRIGDKKLSKAGKNLLQRAVLIAFSADMMGFLTFLLSWIAGIAIRTGAVLLIFIIPKIFLDQKEIAKKKAAADAENQQVVVAAIIQSQAASAANQALQTQAAQNQEEATASAAEAKNKSRNKEKALENSRDQDEQNEQAAAAKVAQKKMLDKKSQEKQVAQSSNKVTSTLKQAAPKANPQSITSVRPGGSYQSRPYSKSTRTSSVPTKNAAALGLNGTQPISPQLANKIVPVDPVLIEKIKKEEDNKIASLIKDTFTKKLN